jgi:hypothetical protein
MAIKLNVNRVLQQAEKRALEPVPLPKVQVGKSKAWTAKKSEAQPPDDLVKDLWDKMVTVKKERAKLSTRSAQLVMELEHRLRSTEGPGTAEAFMSGNVPLPELREHYSKIQELTDQAIELYDKIRHVEQYGELPAEKQPEGLIRMSGVDVSLLQLELEKLRDLICKTKRKIAVGKAKNPLRINEWHEKLALAEARREDVRLKIKKLQYDARDKRAGYQGS